MTMVFTHLSYLAISIAVTVFVAKTLKEHGAVFMTGDDKPTPLVRAKSHLLIVGFYLINLGMIALALKYGGDAVDTKTAMEVVSTKLGGIILGIGFMHFLMMALFAGERSVNNRRGGTGRIPVATEA